MAIRSFIALAVPQEMANALGDCAAQMAYQDKSNAVRWVDQANYHITLAFLGDQQEEKLEQLADRLDKLLHCGELELAISHLSPFPESRPKLIAAILKRSEQLDVLHSQVMSAVIASDIQTEKRRFSPHITLGRYRHSRNHFAGVIPAGIKAAGEAIELSIFESQLTPSGAEYEAIFRFPLNEFEFDEI